MALLGVKRRASWVKTTGHDTGKSGAKQTVPRDAYSKCEPGFWRDARGFSIPDSGRCAAGGVPAPLRGSRNETDFRSRISISHFDLKVRSPQGKSLKKQFAGKLLQA